MPELQLPLARLQEWMQAVLVHPGGAAAGTRSKEAAALVDPGEVEGIVRSRGALTALERLGIYQEMYPLRMVEALEADYPALAQLLGDEAFARLVRDYVGAHPSRGYTLNRLGDRLPEFVAGWGPVRRRGLLADLARLELAITEVFDASEERPLGAEVLAHVDAAEWPRLAFVPVAAFRLVTIRPAALAAFERYHGEEPAARSSRRRVSVVLFRRDFVVKRRELPAPAAALLGLLASGLPLGEALHRAARGRGCTLPSAALAALFGEWGADGFFREASVPPI